MPGKAARLAAAAFLAAALALSTPSVAYGAGGVELAECTVINGEVDVSPVPSNAWKFWLHFSKNVSYANNGQDRAFIEDNAAKIHLLTEDGKEVEGYAVRPGGTQEERQVMYIDLHEWLEPLTVYQIVVEPGILAANGSDVSTERYVITFRTSALCQNGLTVFENALMVVVPVVVAAGVVGAVIKRRRARG